MGFGGGSEVGGERRAQSTRIQVWGPGKSMGPSLPTWGVLWGPTELPGRSVMAGLDGRGATGGSVATTEVLVATGLGQEPRCCPYNQGRDWRLAPRGALRGEQLPPSWISW